MQFLATHIATSTSPVQVLTGDFNAEPHEFAIRYLLGKERVADMVAVEREESSAGDASSDTAATEVAGEQAPAPTGFVDAWEHMQLFTSEEASNNDNGLTFPACNPVKRIDFIMVRNHSSSSEAQSRPAAIAKVVDFRIVGQDPTEDTSKFDNDRCFAIVLLSVLFMFLLLFHTEYLVGSREGLGMNDKDSPIWASDHFAVVADLHIVRDTA